jgi:hypothetical protein
LPVSWPEAPGNIPNESWNKCGERSGTTASVVVEFELDVFLEIIVEQFVSAEVVSANGKQKFGLAVVAKVSGVHEPQAFA